VTGQQTRVAADERLEQIFDLTEAQKNDPVFMQELKTKGYKLEAGSPLEITFTVPRDAKVGNTATRFRVSSLGGLHYFGYAADGEVEDHIVKVGQKAQTPVRLLEGTTNSVIITGSALRDELIIDRNTINKKTGEKWVSIQLNGVTYTAESLGIDKIENIFFDGIYGADVVTVLGLAESTEIVTMTPFSTDQSKIGTTIIGYDQNDAIDLTIRIINAQNTTFDGGSGANKVADAVTMYDSNESDSLILRPGYAQMSGTFYTNTVTNAKFIDAESINSGYDTVMMYGTTGNENYLNMLSTDKAILKDSQSEADASFVNTAKAFADVQVFNLGGTGNRAQIDVSSAKETDVMFSRGPLALGNSLDVNYDANRVRVYGFDSQTIVSNGSNTITSALIMGTPQNEYLYGKKTNSDNLLKIFAWGTTDLEGDDYILELAYNAVEKITVQSVGQTANKAQFIGQMLDGLDLEGNWDTI